MLKRQAAPKAAPSHEDLFMQRYERLLEMARHLNGQSSERAEDLVHNAFIQFTFARPDLQSIQDLDSYLFIMLRNMNVSQVRRAMLIQAEKLSVADYDSAETG